MSKKLVGILLFDEVEVLDFCGPFEVFSIASAYIENSYEVVTIAQKAPIAARNGLVVTPKYVIGSDEIPKLDILLVPGGMGTLVEVKNEALIDWIKTTGSSADFVLSVCTGVSLLGKAGLLMDNSIVTTHHACFDIVRPDCPPSVKFCKCRRFIDNGKVLSSAGISAGIDLSFYFVKKQFGKDAAKLVADNMEYDWKDVDVDVQTCTCQPS